MQLRAPPNRTYELIGRPAPAPFRAGGNLGVAVVSTWGGLLVGLRMAWNLLALTSGSLAFGFAIYWLIGDVWWEGLAAILIAPFLGLALIAAATCVETVRKHI